MSQIYWDESMPSDNSKVAKAPEWVRDVWKQIATGVNTSLYWPGSGGDSDASQGDLKPGATKAWFGTDSQLSFGASATHRGRLMLTSDVSDLYMWDSSTTLLVGSPRLIEHATEYVGARWVEQSGSYQTRPTTPNQIIGGTVSFPTAYDGVPTVQVFSGATTHFVAAPITGVTTALFTSQVSGSADTFTYRWVSLGTITQS